MNVNLYVRIHNIYVMLWTSEYNSEVYGNLYSASGICYQSRTHGVGGGGGGNRAMPPEPSEFDTKSMHGYHDVTDKLFSFHCG